MDESYLAQSNDAGRRKSPAQSASPSNEAETMTKDSKEKLAHAVATGTYTDVVGPEKAARYFDAVDECQKGNLAYAYRTSSKRGGMNSRSSAQALSPYFD